MKEGNRFTFHIKMFILLIILLLFSFSVLATCPEVQEDCVKEEEFNKNPTAENLQKIDEPTVDQFIKLKPGEKIKYLDQNYREDLAENYYQSNGPGANHEVDKKFFKTHISGEFKQKAIEYYSGKYAGQQAEAQSRINIRENKEAVQELFKDEYGTDFFFEQVDDNFAWDSEKKILSNGKKTIPLSGVIETEGIKSGIKLEDIENIKTVANGIEITAKGGKKYLLTGDGELDVASLDGESVVLQQGESGYQHTLVRTGDNLDISASSDGSVSVKGKARGIIQTDNGWVKILENNDELLVEKNGDVHSEGGAVVRTPELYLQGAFDVKHKKKGGIDVKLHDQGGQPSVMIDLTTSLPSSIDSSVHPTFTSGGQSSKEALTIHLNQQPPKNWQKSSSAEAYVFSKGVKLVVEGKGKMSYSTSMPVGSGFVARHDTASFTGKTISSQFDWQQHGLVEQYQAKGQMLIAQRDYSADVTHDGATFTKMPSLEKESFSIECTSCQEGEEIASMAKRVSSQNGDFALPMKIVNQNGRGSPVFTKETLGALGENQPIITSKDMLFLGEGDDKESWVKLSDDKIKVELTAQEQLQRAGMNLGIRGMVGQEIVVTEDQRIKIAGLAELLSNGDYQKLENINPDDYDDASKRLILQSTGIDLDSLKNDEYKQKIIAGFDNIHQKGGVLDRIETIKQKFGVELTADGVCVSGCEKLDKALRYKNALAHHYLRLKVAQKESDIDFLEAEVAVGKAKEEDVIRLQNEIKNIEKKKKQWNTKYSERQESKKQVAVKQVADSGCASRNIAGAAAGGCKQNALLTYFTGLYDSGKRVAKEIEKAAKEQQYLAGEQYLQQQYVAGLVSGESLDSQTAEEAVFYGGHLRELKKEEKSWSAELARRGPELDSKKSQYDALNNDIKVLEKQAAKYMDVHARRGLSISIAGKSEDLAKLSAEIKTNTDKVQTAQERLRIIRESQQLYEIEVGSLAAANGDNPRLMGEVYFAAGMHEAAVKEFSDATLLVSDTEISVDTDPLFRSLSVSCMELNSLNCMSQANQNIHDENVQEEVTNMAYTKFEEIPALKVYLDAQSAVTKARMKEFVESRDTSLAEITTSATIEAFNVLSVSTFVEVGVKEGLELTQGGGDILSDEEKREGRLQAELLQAERVFNKVRNGEPIEEQKLPASIDARLIAEVKRAQGKALSRDEQAALARERADYTLDTEGLIESKTQYEALKSDFGDTESAKDIDEVLENIEEQETLETAALVGDIAFGVVSFGGGYLGGLSAAGKAALLAKTSTKGLIVPGSKLFVSAKFTRLLALSDPGNLALVPAGKFLGKAYSGGKKLKQSLKLSKYKAVRKIGNLQFGKTDDLVKVASDIDNVNFEFSRKKKMVFVSDGSTHVMLEGDEALEYLAVYDNYKIALSPHELTAARSVSSADDASELAAKLAKPDVIEKTKTPVSSSRTLVDDSQLAPTVEMQGLVGCAACVPASGTLPGQFDELPPLKMNVREVPLSEANLPDYLDMPLGARVRDVESPQGNFQIISGETTVSRVDELDEILPTRLPEELPVEDSFKRVEKLVDDAKTSGDTPLLEVVERRLDSSWGDDLVERGVSRESVEALEKKAAKGVSVKDSMRADVSVSPVGAEDVPSVVTRRTEVPLDVGDQTINLQKLPDEFQELDYSSLRKVDDVSKLKEGDKIVVSRLSGKDPFIGTFHENKGKVISITGPDGQAIVVGKNSIKKIEKFDVVDVVLSKRNINFDNLPDEFRQLDFDLLEPTDIAQLKKGDKIVVSRKSGKESIVGTYGAENDAAIIMKDADGQLMIVSKKKIAGVEKFGEVVKPSFIDDPAQINSALGDISKQDPFKSWEGYYNKYKKKNIVSVVEEGKVYHKEFKQIMSKLDSDHPEVFVESLGGWNRVFTKDFPANGFPVERRFYFNAKSASNSHELTETLARKLSDEGIPFQIKSHPNKARYSTRTDNTVLYVPEEHTSKVEEIINGINTNKFVDDEVPMLSNKIKQGVSTAQSPKNGQSFGQSRSKALLEVHQIVAGGTHSEEEISSITMYIFKQHGIDPHEPWKNLEKVELVTPKQIQDQLQIIKKGQEPVDLTSIIEKHPEVHFEQGKATLSSQIGEGTKGVVYEGSLEGVGDDLVFKTAKVKLGEFDRGTIEDNIDELFTEMRNAQEVCIYTPCPAYHGIYEIDGVPFLVSEKIEGVHFFDLTDEQVVQYFSEEKISLMRDQLKSALESGWDSGDIQAMVLTKPQTLGGVQYTEGDIVFMDLAEWEKTVVSANDFDESVEIALEDAMIFPLGFAKKGLDTAKKYPYSSEVADIINKAKPEELAYALESLGIKSNEIASLSQSDKPLRDVLRNGINPNEVAELITST